MATVRVVAVTPAYPPDSRVGAWLATHSYLRHLVRSGHEVQVLTPGRFDHYDFEGVTVWSSAKGRSAPARLAAWGDVVVSHCGDHGAGLRFADGAGLPSVRFAHGANASMVGADLAVFNSVALADASTWEGPSIICRPPTDHEAHRVPERGDSITIINCTREKGVVTADAVARAMPDRDWLAVEGGYGRQERPRGPWWTHCPTQRDMRTVWAQTRILLMPSVRETWGMVGVEAMASGIPVIAHPTPGLRESLGPAGIFIDRDDIPGWVAAIEALDDPSVYSAASDAARARSADLAAAVPGDLDRFRFALEDLCAS